MTDAQLNALWTRDHAHGAPGRARRVPHRRRADPPPRPRRGRHPATAGPTTTEREPRAHRRGPLIDLRRLPPLRVQRMNRAAESPPRRCADGPHLWAAAAHLRSYAKVLSSRPRHADRTNSSRRAGGSVIEIGCGTGRNLIAAARAYPGRRTSSASTSHPRCCRRRAPISGGPGSKTRIKLALGDAARFDAASAFRARARSIARSSPTASR